MASTGTQLPLYQCNKKVRAAKITDILHGNVLVFEDVRAQHLVSQEYLDKHKPKLGGYYVQYEDGYESWSPKEAFEDGYTLVK